MITKNKHLLVEHASRNVRTFSPLRLDINKMEFQCYQNIQFGSKYSHTQYTVVEYACQKYESNASRNHFIFVYKSRSEK